MMKINQSTTTHKNGLRLISAVAGVMILALACPVNIFSSSPQKPYRPQRRPAAPEPQEWPDTIALSKPLAPGAEVVGEEIWLEGDTIAASPVDTLAVAVPPPAEASDPFGEKVYTFNPDPTRAVWLSALFPGLGQLYNRRYWKLPIIIGGYMGLGYATSWNNSMLRDYSRAYTDLMDGDPSTKSYMDFFPPTTSESDLNRTWLENVLRSRKNYYRRNRDLCIICMVGVYLLAMVDAYVDASLSHFDISPSLSMDVTPALIQDSRDRYPAVGLQWAFNF